MSADAVVLALLAAGDVAFLAWLRRRRARRLRVERMYSLLRLHPWQASYKL
ncbi:MAG TPA: hypothetical protein VLW65_09420 [Bryobacteraceae bacterium]|nr:hypothetical protein [Bryobacteraceae bacterium]